MKNIYEDGTLPGAPDTAEIKRQPKAPPTRPRKQLEPTPMQQERQQQAQPLPAPYGAMPVYGAPVYPYVQVGTDANGQPVYAPAPQMPYPQAMPVYPYAPYMPPVPQAPIVPEQPAAAKSDANPGTRVLYQSPDFDMSDGTSKNTEIGASFAQGSLRQETVDLQEEVEVENVALASAAKAERAVPVSESIEIDEVDFDAVELSSLMREKQTAFADDEEGEITEETFFAKKNTNGDVSMSQPQKNAKAGKKEKKKLSRYEIVRRTILGVAIPAIIISAGMLINEFRLAEQNEDVENEISNLIIEEPTTEKGKDNEGEEEPTEVQLTPEQQWAKIKQEYPNVIFPANIQLKYAKLYAENQDFVGYLSAEGVGLNLPVVQAKDDEEYLKKNFYGQTTKYGCPFVTHLNNIQPLDMNTVIFGHHMNNKTIFGTLDAYKKIDGFKKAPVITFNTLYKDYHWKIIAAFITNAYGKDDVNNYIFPYYFTKLSTYDRFSAYLNELSQRSLYDTGVDVVATDRILTLSTCSHEFEDARFVVVARLVRPGESTSVDTTKAVVNSNPRYPQAYYSAKKIKTNPYKNASQWQAG